MNLTIKILLTLTFIATIAKRWIVATSVATLSAIADRTARATPAMRENLTKQTGAASLKALGATVWLTALGALMWIWL